MITQESKIKSQDHVNKNDTEAQYFLTRFGDVPTFLGHDYGRSSPKAKAISASGHHLGHAAAHIVAKSSHGYTVAIFYGTDALSLLHSPCSLGWSGWLVLIYVREEYYSTGDTVAAC